VAAYENSLVRQFGLNAQESAVIQSAGQRLNALLAQLRQQNAQILRGKQSLSNADAACGCADRPARGNDCHPRQPNTELCEHHNRCTVEGSRKDSQRRSAALSCQSIGCMGSVVRKMVVRDNRGSQAVRCLERSRELLRSLYHREPAVRRA
jgi:hypothetical protein